MKKLVVVLLLAAFFAGTISLYAGKPEKMYAAAITEADPAVKLQKLEAYYEKYGRKKKYQSPALFTQIINTAAKVKKFDVLVKYSELALASEVLTETDKVDIKLSLAQYYFSTGKDMEKADKIASEVIAFGKTFNNPHFTRTSVARAERIKIEILNASAKDADTAKVALQKSIDVFKKDYSNRSAQYVLYFVKKLYNDFDAADTAIKTLDELCANNQTTKLVFLDQLAAWYMEDGMDAKAAGVFMKSQSVKPDSKKAYYIGKLTVEEDETKALQALAASCALSQDAYAQRAKQLMERIVKRQLKEKAQETAEEGAEATEPTPEQISEVVNKLIEEAKAK